MTLVQSLARLFGFHKENASTRKVEEVAHVDVPVKEVSSMSERVFAEIALYYLRLT